jgi:hypothetical protein
MRLSSAIWQCAAAATLLGMTASANALDQNNPAVVGALPHRPTPPDIIPGQMPQLIDCTASQEKIDIDVQRMMESPDSWFGQVERLAGHTERLIIWYGAQFVRSGRWDEAQRDAFASTLFERAELAESMTFGETLMTSMLEGFGRAAELSAQGDKRAACEAMLATLMPLNDAPAIMQRQWDAITAIYTAEARRRHVRLPE